MTNGDLYVMKGDDNEMLLEVVTNNSGEVGCNFYGHKHEQRKHGPRYEIGIPHDSFMEMLSDGMLRPLDPEEQDWAVNHRCQTPISRDVQGDLVRCGKRCVTWAVSLTNGYEGLCEEHGRGIGPQKRPIKEEPCQTSAGP